MAAAPSVAPPPTGPSTGFHFPSRPSSSPSSASSSPPRSSIDGGKVEELVSRLSLISKIQAGQKLDTASMDICEDTWYTNLIVRSFLHTSESRETTLTWIKSVTEEGVAYASAYGRSSSAHERGLGLLILEALKDTTLGFPGLKGTYKSDHLMVARIETHEKFLNLQIAELEQLYRPTTLPPTPSAATPSPYMAPMDMKR